jgi:hypothetical protein
MLRPIHMPRPIPIHMPASALLVNTISNAVVTITAVFTLKFLLITMPPLS